MNLDKLDEAIAAIEASPEEHDQGVWILRERSPEEGWCRTAACLAGRLVLDDGWRPVFTNSGSDCAQALRVSKDGRERNVWTVARKLLGIDHNQAKSLFYAADLDEIKRIRDAYAAGAR